MSLLEDREHIAYARLWVQAPELQKQLIELIMLIMLT
jgi:hypothetical protein